MTSPASIEKAMREVVEPWITSEHDAPNCTMEKGHDDTACYLDLARRIAEMVEEGPPTPQGRRGEK